VIKITVTLIIVKFLGYGSSAARKIEKGDNQLHQVCLSVWLSVCLSVCAIEKIKPIG
jgi:hypothetical protein